MINVALYSDQIIPANARIDLRLAEMMVCGEGRIGYIPSGPDPDRHFFDDSKAYYAQCGFSLTINYDLDTDHTRAELDDLLACDAIHLSGGDTGAFLRRLRRSAMLEELRRWAKSGGILIGTSAGAILMTPTIAVDALFSERRPEDVEDGAALDLLPFEFFPHLNAEPTYLDDLVRYSKHTPRPIIACPDGDGVIVTNGKIECIGDPLWIANGAVNHVCEMALAEISPSQNSG